jgi:uncharacterized protein with PIN domain
VLRQLGSEWRGKSQEQSGVVLDVGGDERLAGLWVNSDCREPNRALDVSLQVRRVRLALRRGAKMTQLLRTVSVCVFLGCNALIIFAMVIARRWGRGAHAAALNFGDGFAYALAHSRNAPLLFVGRDFSRTDLPAA